MPSGGPELAAVRDPEDLAVGELTAAVRDGLDKPQAPVTMAQLNAKCAHDTIATTLRSAIQRMPPIRRIAPGPRIKRKHRQFRRLVGCAGAEHTACTVETTG